MFLEIKNISTQELMVLIEERNKQTISLQELYELASNASGINEQDLKTIEYSQFYDVITKLCKCEFMKKYGYNTNSRGLQSLYNRYKLIKKMDNTLSEDEKAFLHTLNSAIPTDIYFKNYDKFIEDKEKLNILSEFLNSITKDTTYISINERSYELFGYEKELSGDKLTQGLLKRVNIDLEKLHCFEKYTPLQCHTMSNFYKKESRNILIIENLDTYLSFLRVINETPLGEHIDMLIYGGGNTIAGNFKQHSIYSINENDNIKYFGDIDPAGLSIFKSVKEANRSLNIKLDNKLYKLAIKVGINRGIHNIHNENQNMPTAEEVNKLLTDLDCETAIKFKDIIYNGKYIPQEAVNYNVLLTEVINTLGR